MKRSFVKVARMRIEDVCVGDVVNREPDSQTGWFEVAETTSLFNNDIQLADRSELLTVSGPFFTIVGVQFVSEAEIADQPPSPLPSIAGEDEDEDEQSVSADQPVPVAHAAPVSQPAPVAHAAPVSQPAPVAHAAPVSQPAPVAHAAKSDEEYGDQSHAEKGALPQLPSRQAQPASV